jgi:hypothetical protein
MGKDKTSLTAVLKEATEGLTYMSESDFPVKPFFMKGEGRKSISASDIPKAKKPIKQIDFDEFFGAATSEEDWYGPEEKKTAKRFRELVKLLKENLTDIKVYKSGKVKMDVYVVGKTADGDFAGISTKVVET